jgi:hypothetical protein
MDSPLLPLVTIFEFYFELIQRKVAINLLENYLYNVGLLDFAHLEKREVEAIQRTIQRVYIHCLDYWPEDYEIKFRDLINQNRLRYTL